MNHHIFGLHLGDPTTVKSGSGSQRNQGPSRSLPEPGPLVKCMSPEQTDLDRCIGRCHLMPWQLDGARLPGGCPREQRRHSA